MKKILFGLDLSFFILLKTSTVIVHLERALRAKQREELKLVGDNPELLKEMKRVSNNPGNKKYGSDESDSDEDEGDYPAMIKGNILWFVCFMSKWLFLLLDDIHKIYI